MIVSPLLFALLGSASAYTQITFGPPGGQISTPWRSIGPFQLGTREGPLLPPLYPDIERDHHNSPFPDGGLVTWKDVQEDADGWIEIGDPDIRYGSAENLVALHANKFNNISYSQMECIESYRRLGYSTAPNSLSSRTFCPHFWILLFRPHYRS